MIKTLLILSVGLFGGLWISWPGIVSNENWQCAKEVVNRSKQQKGDVRALMAVSPKTLLKRSNSDQLTNLRLVADACFR